MRRLPRTRAAVTLELQTKIREVSQSQTEKAPNKAFSWLKVATTAFSFKTLLRHYAKLALTPQYDNYVGVPISCLLVREGSFEAVVFTLHLINID